MSKALVNEKCGECGEPIEDAVGIVVQKVTFADEVWESRKGNMLRIKYHGGNSKYSRVAYHIGCFGTEPPH